MPCYICERCDICDRCDICERCERCDLAVGTGGGEVEGELVTEAGVRREEGAETQGWEQLVRVVVLVLGVVTVGCRAECVGCRVDCGKCVLLCYIEV